MLIYIKNKIKHLRTALLPFNFLYFFIFILLILNYYFFFVFDNNLKLNIPNVSTVEIEESKQLYLENNINSKRYPQNATTGSLKTNKEIVTNALNSSSIPQGKLGRITHVFDRNGKMCNSKMIQDIIINDTMADQIKKQVNLSIENAKNINNTIQSREFERAENYFISLVSSELVSLVKISLSYNSYRNAILYYINNPDDLKDLILILAEIQNASLHDEKFKIYLRFFANFGKHFCLYRFVDGNLHFSVLTHAKGAPTEFIENFFDKPNSIFLPNSNFDINSPYRLTSLSDKDLMGISSQQYLATEIRIKHLDLIINSISENNIANYFINNSVLSKLIVKSNNENTLEFKDYLLYYLKKESII